MGKKRWAYSWKHTMSTSHNTMKANANMRQVWRFTRASQDFSGGSAQLGVSLFFVIVPFPLSRVTLQWRFFFWRAEEAEMHVPMRHGASRFLVRRSHVFAVTTRMSTNWCAYLYNFFTLFTQAREKTEARSMYNSYKNILCPHLFTRRKHRYCADNRTNCRTLELRQYLSYFLHTCVILSEGLAV